MRLVRSREGFLITGPVQKIWPLKVENVMKYTKSNVDVIGGQRPPEYLYLAILTQTSTFSTYYDEQQQLRSQKGHPRVRVPIFKDLYTTIVSHPL